MTVKLFHILISKNARLAIMYKLIKLNELIAQLKESLPDSGKSRPSRSIDTFAPMLMGAIICSKPITGNDTVWIGPRET